MILARAIISHRHCVLRILSPGISLGNAKPSFLHAIHRLASELFAVQLQHGFFKLALRQQFADATGFNQAVIDGLLLILAGGF